MQAQQQKESEELAAGIPNDDRARIKMVAAHIAGSIHPARFQRELGARTRHNHHFLFLEPGHPWHRYYQFCITVYKGYREQQWQQHKREQMEASSSAAAAPQQPVRPQPAARSDVAATLLDAL